MHEAAVLNVIRRFVKYSDAPVSLAAALTKDLGLDSLDVLELTVEVEESLQISIPDADLKGIVTVQDFLDVVQRRRDETG
jgi:acyl carrier protein